MTLDAKDFASSFKDFMDTMSSQKTGDVPVFFKRLSEHFGQDPTHLPIVSEQFAEYDHPNVHLSIESFVAEPGCTATLYGMLSERYDMPTMSKLVASDASGPYGRPGPQEGPVQYVNVHLGDRTLACVETGLYLICDGNTKLAVLLRPGAEYSSKQGIYLDVMAPEREQAEKFLAGLRSTVRQKNVYRNHVLSIEQAGRHGGGLNIKFHALPEVKQTEIILPTGLLGRIERQTIGFGRFSEALLEAKRHLKRGMLLYGPPGTGKTLTAMYLASQMKDRTILLLTGRSLGLIEQTCALARVLQPAMIVMEDVDLVAEERTRQQGCATPVLFELLNEMDGLSDDVDVIFLLTTNRADILEPALAARPGRVDQAFEIPLPDVDCRRKLFDLYSDGLTMKVEDTEPFIQRTEGASAAFMCEMLRKAALFAAEDGLPIIVLDKHLDEALRELVISGGAITRSLLGFREGQE